MTTGNNHKIKKEADLVAQLKKRDRKAFTYLYDNYSPALYGVIFRILRNEELSQDVLQETFVKIWDKITSFDHGKGALFTWLASVARNNAIDKTRSKEFKNNLKDLSIDLVNLDLQFQDRLNPDTLDIRKWVNGLKEEQKQVLVLSYFKGYTQEEIAKELSIPLGTVKTRMRAAIKALRKVFA